MRTTREKTPVIYAPGEEFPIGGSRVVRQTDADQVTLVAAGITLHEAMKAADALAAEGIAARVIDLYTRQADRRRDAARGGARRRAASSRWRTTGRRAASGEAVLAASFGDSGSNAPRIAKLAVRQHARIAPTHAEQLARGGDRRGAHREDAAAPAGGRWSWSASAG